MNVRLTKEQKIKLLNSQDVFDIMQQVLMRENKIRRNKEAQKLLDITETICKDRIEALREIEGRD